MAHKYHATAHEAFEARREREARDPANWGHAGDLAHIAGLLNQALAFIGAKED